MRLSSGLHAPPSALAAVGGACGLALLGFLLASSDRGLAFSLVGAQTLGVGALVRLGFVRGGQWISATSVTAAAWTALYLVPCWVYVVEPSLFGSAVTPTPAIALVNLSLVALIVGVLLPRVRGGAPAGTPQTEVVEVHSASRRALACWAIVGLGCLAGLMALNGGPVAYVSHLDMSGQLNRGLTYLIWGVLFLRFAPLCAVTARWARGRAAGAALLAYLVAGCGIVVVTGARAFIAVAAAQILLLFVLLRRRLRLRTVLGPALLVGALLVFGLGGVKRFQGYNDSHPGGQRTFLDYAVYVAPREAVGAYVNNYVDGVRLIALARRVVPAQAGYEYGTVAVRFLLKPIPSPVRPDLPEAPAIRRAFHPPGGFAYAIPLQADAYIEFGLPGVAVAFFVVGLVLAAIDRRLGHPRRRSLVTLLPLATLAVQIPVLLRSSLPSGLVFLLIDVIGMWVAALTVVGGPGSLAERTRRSLGRTPG